MPTISHGDFTEAEITEIERLAQAGDASMMNVLHSIRNMQTTAPGIVIDDTVEVFNRYFRFSSSGTPGSGLVQEKDSYFKSLNADNVKDIPYLKDGACINRNSIEYLKTIDAETGLYAIVINSSDMYDGRITFEKFKSNIVLAYLTVVLKNGIDSGIYYFTVDERFYNTCFVGKKSSDLFKWGKDNVYFNKSDILSINEINCQYLILNEEDNIVDNLHETLRFSPKTNISNTALFTSFCDHCDAVRRLANIKLQEHRNRNEILNRRPNTSTNKFRSIKTGEYVKHKIPFAIELECYGQNGSTVAKMSRTIDNAWGVCRDGSLGSNIGYPIEIQSPILSGTKGEGNVIETCNILNDLKFVTDKTCGMHVHFGCGDAFIRSEAIMAGIDKPSNLISLYLFHRLFEDVIVSFLPTTRRVNQYCGQFKNGTARNGSIYSLGSLNDAFDKMKGVKNLEQFEMYWYMAKSKGHINDLKRERYTISRYMGVNFHSLLKENHIEIRYHSGTLNYEKILYWVNLHGRIIELCASGVINQKKLEEIKNNNYTLEAMTAVMFNVLKLDKDTVEYLMDRQERFKNADTESVDEIVIDKTKKLSIV